MKIITQIFVIIIALSACDSNLPEINQNDNNIPLTNVTNYTFTGIIENSEEEWYYSNASQRNTLLLQDISNIDSIIFQAGLRTPYGNVSCFIDLYDIDKGVSIYGSELTSDIAYFVTVKSSGDLAYYFDEERKYNLALRIKTSNEGIAVQSGYNSYLSIYYKTP